MQAIYRDAAQTLVTVTLAAGEVLNGEPGPGAWQLGPDASADFIRAAAAAGTAIAAYPVPPAVPPDCGSLAFWLTALDLWLRDDGQGGKVARTVEVQAAVKRLVDAGSALGKLAARQLEYANTVVLADLLKLAPAFGFTAADCAESLWRAEQVRKGDLSGVWPLPA